MAISERKALKNLFRETINNVRICELEKTLDGKSKKRTVMKALDILINNVDIPYVPEWIERRITRPILRKLLSAFIDVIVEMFNMNGWFVKKDLTVEKK